MSKPVVFQQVQVPNFFNGLKSVVISKDSGKLRNVSFRRDGTSWQVATEGDIIVFRQLNAAPKLSFLVIGKNPLMKDAKYSAVEKMMPAETFRWFVSNDVLHTTLPDVGNVFLGHVFLDSQVNEFFDFLGDFDVGIIYDNIFNALTVSMLNSKEKICNLDINMTFVRNRTQYRYINMKPTDKSKLKISFHEKLSNKKLFDDRLATGELFIAEHDKPQVNWSYAKRMPDSVELLTLRENNKVLMSMDMYLYDKNGKLLLAVDGNWGSSKVNLNMKMVDIERYYPTAKRMVIITNVHDKSFGKVSHWKLYTKR